MGKECNWVIYKITNPNGRIYVGKTNNFRKRMGDYKNINCGNQKLLFKSLNKYGFENHKVDILENFNGTNSYCNGKEIFWIKTNMSNIYVYPEQKGLNLTNGGCGRLGCRHSKETKDKLSKYFKENPIPYKPRIKTKEEKERWLAALKRTLDLKGRKKDIPKIKKPRVYLKGVRNSPETEFKKGLTPWNKGTKGLLKAWNKGLKWHGTEEERREKFGKNLGKKFPNKKPSSKEAIARMAETKRKKIIIQNLISGEIKTYNSIKEAVMLDKYSSNTIWGQLKGKIKTPKKYIIKYAA